MPRFVSDKLKSNKMFKNAIKKLPFAIRYVLDWYKTHKMSDKNFPRNAAVLKLIF